MQTCQRIGQYQCKNCKFFSDHSNNHGHGECHRYPPVVVKKQESTYDVFPLVTKDNFCGEFCDKESL